ncbi:MAG: hypothetical protein RMJ82_04925 [Gemmatales bacterium]|nr:hypothetical protein [Gemmatales bacterium]
MSQHRTVAVLHLMPQKTRGMENHHDARVALALAVRRIAALAPPRPDRRAATGHRAGLFATPRIIGKPCSTAKKV